MKTKLTALLLTFAALTFAATPTVTAFHQKAPPPVPFASGFRENVMVLIHDTSVDVDGYKVTLRYQDFEGKCKTAVQLVSKTEGVSDEYTKVPTVVVYRIPGITYLDVTVKPLGATADVAVTVK